MPQITALSDFPKLNNSSDKSTLAAKLQLRPFGCAVEDLEINFDINSPALVTNLIRLCTVTPNDTRPAEHFYWSLEVGKRIECLIRIATSEHSPHIVTVLKCQKEGCGKYLELRLSLDTLLSETYCNSDDDSCSLTVLGKNIRLRKPTGFDQLSWLSLNHANQMEAVESIIATLLIHNAELPDEIKSCSNEAIEQIGEGLSEIDPLIDYKIELECPLCLTKELYRLDLEKLLLKKLKEIQKDLLSEIHQLASNYHWTENEIIAMPASRRSLYLSVIEGEKS